jgi:hypothetical protein
MAAILSTRGLVIDGKVLASGGDDKRIILR